MKLALEFDDFSPKNSSFGLLENLREHFPGFKVTMFTVPWDIRWGDQAPITDEKYAPWVKALKKNADWLEIAVHGLTHMPMEFAEMSADGAFKRITVAEKMFDNLEIPFVKIFKAPHWALSKVAEAKIKEMGYLIAKDGYYHWNLADELDYDKYKDSVIVGHGHVQNTCDNGLEESFQKLMKLPVETEFIKLSEYVNQYGGSTEVQS